ncbi:DUF5133 domain-containing protein [Streptomyces sp. NPDC051561]|uniref:DUF5133 domain-containing protein n=1 Tax=Streptomyces sp. NPDC051561 TaxID=3365658 RepID=UPI00379D9FBC
MLVPDPKVLRELLARYAETRLAHARRPSDTTRRALEDVSYTLCVTTSTSRIDAALAAADNLLARTCCARAAQEQEAGTRETMERNAVEPAAVQEQAQADLAA